MNSAESAGENISQALNQQRTISQNNNNHLQTKAVALKTQNQFFGSRSQAKQLAQYYNSSATATNNPSGKFSGPFISSALGGSQSTKELVEAKASATNAGLQASQGPKFQFDKAYNMMSPSMRQKIAKTQKFKNDFLKSTPKISAASLSNNTASQQETQEQANGQSSTQSQHGPHNPLPQNNYFIFNNIVQISQPQNQQIINGIFGSSINNQNFTKTQKGGANLNGQPSAKAHQGPAASNLQNPQLNRIKSQQLIGVQNLLASRQQTALPLQQRTLSKQQTYKQ